MLHFRHFSAVILRNYGLRSFNHHKGTIVCKIFMYPCRSLSVNSQCFDVLLSPQKHVLPPTNCRKFQSTKVAPATADGGLLKRLLKKLGWFAYSQTRLRRSGYFLYESVADRVNYGKFFELFKLSDTLFSWFLITELHVWMLLVRVMAEGEEGRFLRNCIVKVMWEDVTTRSKKLGAANPSSIQSQLRELSEQFQAALINYDEGLLTDDKVLAGAIWRRFFQQNCANPEDIECLVRYIRRQIKTLDDIPREKILLYPDIIWPELQPINSFINR